MPARPMTICFISCVVLTLGMDAVPAMAQGVAYSFEGVHLDGVPEIPASLKDDLDAYAFSRARQFAGWSANPDQMFLLGSAGGPRQVFAGYRNRVGEFELLTKSQRAIDMVYPHPRRHQLAL